MNVNEGMDLHRLFDYVDNRSSKWCLVWQVSMLISALSLQAGAVITFLAILTATVVRFARHIVNHRQVPAVPTFLKSGTPFPIIPAFLPAAGRVRALGNIFFGDFSVVWMGKLFWSADITFCPLQAAPHFI